MKLEKHVVQHVKGIVLSDKLQGHRTYCSSVINKTEEKFSITLSENEICIIRGLICDLRTALRPWEPVLHEIYSAIAKVKPPLTPMK